MIADKLSDMGLVYFNYLCQGCIIFMTICAFLFVFSRITQNATTRMVTIVSGS